MTAPVPDAQIIAQALAMAQAGDVSGAWTLLAQNGDTYAAAAAGVTSKNPSTPTEAFFSELVQIHWANAVGIDAYNRYFDQVALEHITNYLTYIKDNNAWPPTTFIASSYAQALADNGIPTIAAFDAAWEAAGLSNYWGSFLGMEPDRIGPPYPGFNDINVNDAQMALAQDIVAMGFYTAAHPITGSEGLLGSLVDAFVGMTERAAAGMPSNDNATNFLTDPLFWEAVGQTIQHDLTTVTDFWQGVGEALSSALGASNGGTPATDLATIQITLGSGSSSVTTTVADILANGSQAFTGLNSSDQIVSMGIKSPDGSSTTTNFDPVTGLATSEIIINADKTETDYIFNVDGEGSYRAYNKDSSGNLISYSIVTSDSLSVTTTYYDANYNKTSQVTVDQNGAEISQTDFNTDGSSVTTNFDPTTPNDQAISQVVLNTDDSQTDYVFNGDGSYVATDVNASYQITSISKVAADNSAVTTYYDSNNNPTSQTTFNSNGIQTDRINYGSDGAITENWVYLYTNGQLTRANVYNGNGQQIERINYGADGAYQAQQLDANGNIVSAANVNAVGEMTEQFTLTNGVITKDQIYTYTDGELTHSNIYTGAGQQTDHINYGSDGSYQDQKLDATGSIVSATNVNAAGEVTEQFTLTNGVITEDQIFTNGQLASDNLYNSAGQQTERINYGADGAYQDQLFDASGNIASATNVNAAGEVTEQFTLTNGVITEDQIFTNGQLASDNLYNSAGQQTERINYGSDGAYQAQQFDTGGNIISATNVNAAGEITEQFTLTNGIITDDSVYTNGQLAHENIYNSDGQQTDRINYGADGSYQDQQLNANGNIISATNVNAVGEVTEQFTLTNGVITDDSTYTNGQLTRDNIYNSAGQQTERINYGSDGSYQDQQLDSSGNIISATNVNAAGEMTEQITLTNGVITDDSIYTNGQLAHENIYNSAGQQTDRINYGADGSYQDQQLDANGNVIIATNYDANDQMTEQFLLSNGEITDIIHYNPDGSWQDQQLDANGNVITATNYDANDQMTQQFTLTDNVVTDNKTYTDGYLTSEATFNDAGQQTSYANIDPGTGQIAEFIAIDPNTQQITSATFNLSDGGSQVQSYAGLSNGDSAVINQYSDAGGSGTLEWQIVDYASGGSEAIFYPGYAGLSGNESLVIADYSDANAGGALDKALFNLDDGTSEIETFSGLAAGESGIIDFYSGADGSGALDSQITDFTLGGSQLIFYTGLAAGDISETLDYSGSDGTGTLDSVLTDYVSGGSQETFYTGLEPGVVYMIANYSGEDASGSLINTVAVESNGSMEGSIFSPDGTLAYSQSGSGDPNAFLSYLDSVYARNYPDSPDLSAIANSPDFSTYVDIYLPTSDPSLNVIDLGSLAYIGMGFAGSQSSIDATLNNGTDLIAQYDSSNGNTAGATAAAAALQQAATSASGTAGSSAVLEGAQWNTQVITWSFADATSSSGNLPFSGDISQYATEVEQAFAAWSAATGLTFVEVTDPAQANIQLGAADFDTASTGIIGYTTYQSQNGQMTQATIQIENPSQDALETNANGLLGYTDTQATLVQVLEHEIGHALGFSDNSDVSSIMYYELTAANPGLDSTDTIGAQSLYGQSAGGTDALAQLIQAMSVYAVPAAGTTTVVTPAANSELLLAAAH